MEIERWHNEWTLSRHHPLEKFNLEMFFKVGNNKWSAKIRWRNNYCFCDLEASLYEFHLKNFIAPRIFPKTIKFRVDSYGNRFLKMEVVVSHLISLDPINWFDLGEGMWSQEDSNWWNKKPLKTPRKKSRQIKKSSSFYHPTMRHRSPNHVLSNFATKNKDHHSGYGQWKVGRSSRFKFFFVIFFLKICEWDNQDQIILISFPNIINRHENLLKMKLKIQQTDLKGKCRLSIDKQEIIRYC